MYFSTLEPPFLERGPFLTFGKEDFESGVILLNLGLLFLNLGPLLENLGPLLGDLIAQIKTTFFNDSTPFCELGALFLKPEKGFCQSELLL